MVVLAVSDKVSESLYSDPNPDGDPTYDAILSCGDLRPGYLDFLASRFNAPLFYVRGNHANYVEADSDGTRVTVIHGKNLHRTSTRFGSLSVAGIEGSMRYNTGTYQYSQRQMWLHAFRLVPSLLANRLRFGRYLDIFLTHAPPWGINDQPDPAHQGVRSFRWLIQTFKPRYHIHGHIHLYKPGIPVSQKFFETTVINSYGHQVIEIE